MIIVLWLYFFKYSYLWEMYTEIVIGFSLNYSNWEQGSRGKERQMKQEKQKLVDMLQLNYGMATWGLIKFSYVHLKFSTIKSSFKNKLRPVFKEWMGGGTKVQVHKPTRQRNKEMVIF